MNSNKYLILFSCCKMVKGYNRSAIYDFQRKKIFFIPNSLYYLLDNTSSILNIEKLLTNYPNQKKTIYSYIDFLMNNELGFFSNYPKCFPPINESILDKNQLDELYIEVDKDSSFIFGKKIIQELLFFKVKKLTLILKNNINLNPLLLNLNRTFVTSIDIQLSYDILKDNLNNITLLNNNPIITTIFIISKVPLDSIYHSLSKAVLSTEELCDFTITSEKDMICNLKEFLIAKKFNLFYYKKLFIESNGLIKLHFKTLDSISHIENDLKHILYSGELLKFWSINNDKITICKLCEYRYACGESYIPIMKNNTYIRRDCLYNPLKSSWYEK